MIDSLGLGELGIVAIIAILFLDPKKLGQALRALAKFKSQWMNLQRQVRREMDALALEGGDDARPEPRAAKAALRREAKEAIRTIPSAERAAAAEKIREKVIAWPGFSEAKVVAAFVGGLEEVDTEKILRHVLSQGKTLLLPYVPDTGNGAAMAMAPVEDYDKDLREGTFGIPEPREELRAAPAPEPDLILVPGLAFDEQGGRLGRGLGLYDRYLREHAAPRVGLAFEAQVLRKKLVLETHDLPVDGLITEARAASFSRPRVDISIDKSNA